MTIREWHYDFKLKIDKVDSLDRPNFHPAEIDWLFNEAIELFVKQRYGLTNRIQQGFEVTQKRIDDLKTLVVKCPSSTQPPLPVTLINTREGLYEAKLSDLAFKYLFLVRLEVAITRNNCTKFVNATITQHDDLTSALRDSFIKPSFNWGEVPAVLAAGITQPISALGSIYVYSGGDFTITNVYPEYIKQPQKVSIAGYNNINGVPTINIDSDLPEHTHREIIDLAVDLAARGIQIPELTNLTSQKLLINE